MTNANAEKSNSASSWRKRFAEKVAPVYAEIPAVACIILGGSTARGHADRYSDIELGVFWHEAPTDEQRKLAAQKLKIDFVRHYPFDAAEEVWADDLVVGRSKPEEPQSGVLIEVVHSTTEFVNRTLQSVLGEYDPDLGKQNLISGIVDGIPLAGDNLVMRWKQAARDYPDGLVRSMIERYGIIDHFWRWQMLLDRGENLMLLYQMFSQVEQQVVEMLLALNRTYYFGLKWMDIVTDRLSLAPDDLPRRLKEPFQSPPDVGAKSLIKLVEDTYDLIEREIPQIDTDRLRGYFRYSRPFLEEPPQWNSFNDG